MQTKKLALSLGGGGARSFCYLGVIRALEHNGIEIEHLAAYSGAAIMLCYMANGMRDEDIISEFAKFRMRKFFSVSSLLEGGIFSVNKMTNYLNQYSKGRHLSELGYKVMIPISDVTDNDNQHTIYYTNGDLALLSSISTVIPPLFPLYEHEGKLLADGGFTCLYCAEELRKEGADVVIGLHPDGMKFTYIPAFAKGLSTVEKATDVIIDNFERREHPVDMEIRYFDTEAGLSSFDKAQEMYDAGYSKGLEVLSQVQKLVS